MSESDIPLIVDMDGSLLKTDMLYESFVSSIGNSIATLFHVPFWLLKGKVNLKNNLAERSSIELDYIPYNEELLDFLRCEYNRGRKLYLASAGAPKLVQAVAEHTGIFEDFFVSQHGENFSSNNKAKFLIDKYGKNGFDYVGNSSADLAVWDNARKSIAVNCSDSLISMVQSNEDVIVFDKPKSVFKSCLKALRPHQWFKNVLIALPVFAGHSFDLMSVLMVLLAFSSFSLIASMVYIVNDLLDLNNDRAHHSKCRRSLASGQLPIQIGLLLCPFLFLGGVLVAWFIGYQFTLVLMGYLILTTAYSFKLKKHSVIDVVTLGVLYTVRMIAGIAAVNLQYSPWLLGFSLFLFLSLGIVKRIAEILEKMQQDNTEVKGRGYRVSDLPLLEGMAVASAYSSVIVYFLYINNDFVTVLYNVPELLWLGIPILLFWLSRVLLLTHRGDMHDDPVVFALTDKVSLITGVLFLTVVVLASLI
ncbi:MAG: UbiA family prenyltransferase [Vibrio ordalii]|uniref:UbiA family prenyltransferase n=1 Tax=Vibrio ordalii TaxID=28174 RepID=UPI003F360F08